MGAIYKVKVPKAEEALANDKGIHREVESEGSSNMITYLARENILKVMKRVIANKGSHGIDGMKADELRKFIIKNF